MTFFPSQRIYRNEPPSYGGGTVLTVRLDSIEIAYDEGGSGWWTSDALLLADPSKPVPDWGTFKGAVLHSATVNQLVTAALAGAAPVAAMALASALDKAISGQAGEFAACWAALISAVPVPPEEMEGLQAMAEACHLPAQFVAALNPAAPPAPGMVRARNADGTYRADDPTTPENEAWEPLA